MTSPDRFAALWRSLLPLGRDRRTGGYLRYSWSPADLACREWFVEEALDRDLAVDTDNNGNLYAWWGDPDAAAAGPAGPYGARGAVVTGSHLDSVPYGGAYDGALGVVGALLAIDHLREQGRDTPPRAIGIAVFTEEEGGRFGVPCLGSRLLTGGYDPEAARGLRDRDGITLAEALESAEVDPAGIGPDPDRLARIGAFVELHIEQGRGLVNVDSAVGIGAGIWPHGRWRLDLTGVGNHAGTTAMADRHDPMTPLAAAVLAADSEARLRGGHATIGRITVAPNATNAIAASVSAWLDVRAPDEVTLDDLYSAITKQVVEHAAGNGVALDVALESRSLPVTFHPDLLRDAGVNAPALATAAGHDAGILAAHVPTGMLFVRNPTGVSHAPAESASDADCAAGVTALARALESLAWA
jgi:N-carbamoyl-L-amino-acid hydrolase